MSEGVAHLTDRRGFARALESELERSRRGDQSFALVLVELDRPSPQNGSAGDHAVERVTTALAAVVRVYDVVARVGLTRLALIVPGADSDGATALAERLRTELHRDGGPPIDLSVGVAHYPDHGGSAELLRRSAHTALGVAEELGGDRIVGYSFDLEEWLTRADDEPADERPLTLAELLDLRDPESVDHAQLVAAYAERTALVLGLPSERAARVRLAGLLHDVGKAGIPSTIVRRPGPLDSEQFDEMRGHPEIGARLVEGTDADDLASWIVAHHERPDGRGYPAGLSCDDIPVEASILAVADAYAAMVTDRVYRPAIGEQAARAELERGAGTQFDAQIVNAFLASLP